MMSRQWADSSSKLRGGLRATRGVSVTPEPAVHSEFFAEEMSVMRTQLFRGALALAVALFVSAPAFAKSIVRGRVVDQQGKPVANAVVTMESVDSANRRAETKTNAKGEF